jgi:hypothetical protein
VTKEPNNKALYAMALGVSACAGLVYFTKRTGSLDKTLSNLSERMPKFGTSLRGSMKTKEKKDVKKGPTL